MRIAGGLLALVLVAACASRLDSPRRTSENGVEIVDNGARMFALPDGPRRLSLREEFRIDLEDESLAAEGLGDISAMDVDSRGRIYVFGLLGPGPFVFQFDGSGRFLKSFAGQGQGPGEVMYPHFAGIAGTDEIWVYSQGAQKLVSFDAEGREVHSRPVPTEWHFLASRFRMLANGNVLAQRARTDEDGSPTALVLSLFDGGFEKIADIHEYSLPFQGQRIEEFLAVMPLIGTGDDSFATNCGSRGRDIAVFGLDGRRTRVIRAVFPEVGVPDGYRRAILELTPPDSEFRNIRQFFESVTNFPPFQSLIVDDAGRLYAAGFGRDPETGANACDVFSPDGVRFLRTAIGYGDLFRFALASERRDVVIKNGRCYGVREKSDGFKEVVVRTMTWE